MGSGDPPGVGCFNLSCERTPTASKPTEESSALLAWQRPPWVRVECTARVAMAPCTGVRTNDMQMQPKAAEEGRDVELDQSWTNFPEKKKPRLAKADDEQDKSSTSPTRSAKASGALRPSTGVDHIGPRGVYRPVTENGIPSPQHCGPSLGCIEVGGDLWISGKP